MAKPAKPARKGYWEYKGQHPNFLDCSNYIGILKAFETYERKGKIESGKFQDIDVDTISMSQAELCSWCNKGESKSNVKNILESLGVLRGFLAVRYEENENGDPVCARTFNLVREWRMESKNGRNGKVHISIDRAQREFASKNSLHLQWRTFQDLSGQIPKGLYLWISFNSCTKLVKQDHLLKFLGVVPPAKPKDGSKASKFAKYGADLKEYQLTRKDVVYKIKKGLIYLSDLGLIGTWTGSRDNIDTYHGVTMYAIQKVGYKESKAVGVEAAEEKKKAKERKAKEAIRRGQPARALERKFEKMIADAPIPPMLENLVEFDEADLPY